MGDEQRTSGSLSRRSKSLSLGLPFPRLDLNFSPRQRPVSGITVGTLRENGESCDELVRSTTAREAEEIGRPSTRASDAGSNHSRWSLSTVSLNGTEHQSRWSVSTNGGHDRRRDRETENITALPPTTREFSFSDPEKGLPPDLPPASDNIGLVLARDWSNAVKWRVTGFVAWLAFISPLASSMVAPGSNVIVLEFLSRGLVDDYDGVEKTFIVSVFIFGYVIGSLIAAPLSDLFGRKMILDISTALFFLWEMGCALAPNVTSLIIFRFMAGLGASASLSVGGGVISDLFDNATRGGATAIFSLGPVLGPVIGPICGGFVAESLGWRWIFWILFIVSGLTLVALVLFNKETNPDILTRRHAVEKENHDFGIGPQIMHFLDWGSPKSDDTTATSTVLKAMVMPWKMLLTAPIVTILCIYSAFVYGLLYLLLTTITDVFMLAYHWSLGKAGLAYIGLGVGFLIAVAIIGFTTDRNAARHRAHNNGILIPENRLQVAVYFSFLIPVSFFWYGFTANEHVHYMVPICGLIPFSIGMIGVFLPIQTYLIDAAPNYAACSTAALASSRNLVGTFLPLAAPGLSKALGMDWGNATLGFIAIALIPMPWIIFKYGERLRRMSTWMKSEDEARGLSMATLANLVSQSGRPLSAIEIAEAVEAKRKVKDISIKIGGRKILLSLAVEK